MSTIDRALEIAVTAHSGAVDRSGKPYFLHPLRIMLKMPDDRSRIVAILHDVVEDNPEWTFERLSREGFPDEIIEALDCLTWRKASGESYEDYVRRAASNKLARNVKTADLEDNMDIRRLNRITDKDLTRISRYHRAWTYLQTETEGSP